LADRVDPVDERTDHGQGSRALRAARGSDAREVLARLDHAIDRGERVGRGKLGRLRAGFEASGAGEVSTLARARFAREHPAVRVEPKRFDWGRETAGLHRPALDGDPLCETRPRLGPIADIDPLRIALCWRRGDDSPLVSSFANVTRDLAAAAA